MVWRWNKFLSLLQRISQTLSCRSDTMVPSAVMFASAVTLSFSNSNITILLAAVVLCILSHLRRFTDLVLTWEITFSATLILNPHAISPRFLSRCLCFLLGCQDVSLRRRASCWDATASSAAVSTRVRLQCYHLHLAVASIAFLLKLVHVDYYGATRYLRHFSSY